MVSFETGPRDLIVDQKYIRNVSIIAHVDSGKTTLADCLIGHGDRALDTDKQEADRGITIKSTAISLSYKQKQTINNINTNDNKDEKVESKQIVVPYCIHLTDTPGHTEFGAEVSSALRLSDGALIIVDCINGVTSSTKRLIKQAIDEKIKPVLFINKIDFVFNLCNNINDLYEKYIFFRKIIEDVNVIIKTYSNNNENDGYNNLEIIPQNGMCAFGSGLQSWGFTITDFIKLPFLQRNLMKKGSIVQIYIKKKEQWFDGIIKSIIIDNKDKQEWLNIEYKLNNKLKNKKIKRFSKNIKPNEILTKKKIKRNIK